MERAVVHAAHMSESYLKAFDVVYAGNEFCEKRIPPIQELQRLLSMCKRLSKKVAFLTPYVSDSGMELLGRHLDLLRSSGVPFEVVVNDWGVFHFFASKKMKVPMVAGRLLSARYMQQGHRTDQKGDVTLFPDGFLHLLEEFRIAAVEFNAQGHARACAPQLEKIRVRSHLYHPFMYVTTSRYCSAPNGYRAYAQTPGVPCDRACDHGYAIVHHKGSGHEAHLVGNTYFVRSDMSGFDCSSFVARIVFNNGFDQRYCE